MSATKLARMIGLFRVHKRAIVPGLALAWTVFLLIHPDAWGRVVDLSFFVIFVLIIASQFFWLGRIYGIDEQILSGKPRRGRLVAVTCLSYTFVFVQCIVVLGVVLAWAAFLLMHPVELARSVDRPFYVVAVMLLASQFFLIRRVLQSVERLLPGKPRCRWIGVVAFLLCALDVIQLYPWLETAANANVPRDRNTTWVSDSRVILVVAGGFLGKLRPDCGFLER